MMIKANGFVPRNNHLVVLCHGLLGTSLDLKYLADSLSNKGYVVHRTNSHQLHKSMVGVKSVTQSILQEVLQIKAENPSLQKISIVGNSLGGILARYLAALMYEPETNTFSGLQPGFLLTTATPHLGVLHYTVFDEYAIDNFVFPLRRIVATLAGTSGLDLAFCDVAEFPDLPNSLLYQMATEEYYLAPLKAFSHRRLYANIKNDFLVPLGTSGILDDNEINYYQKALQTTTASGILFRIPANVSIEKDTHTFDPKIAQRYEHSQYLEQMMKGLNSVGWEKLLVYFPSFFPSAHNKIMALTKFYEPFDTWMGYKQGVFIVDDMVKWVESLEQEGSA